MSNVLSGFGGGHIEYPEAYDRAIKARIITNARITFDRTYAADLADILEFCSEGEKWDERGNLSYKDNFAGSMAHGLWAYGKLSEKQVAAILKIVADRKVRKAEWASKDAEKEATRQYVGEVGKRQTFTVKIAHIVVLEGMYGTSWLHILEDTDGNSLTYKGTGNIGEKGQTVEIVATVKDHGVYKGKKQTIIQRPKLVKTLEQAQ